MYNELLKTSGRYARSNKALVEAAIANYEESTKPVAVNKNDPYSRDRNAIMENSIRRDTIANHYHSFVETVNNSLVTEAIYKIFKESVSKEVQNDNTSTSIMRAMVGQYVNENGYFTILNRMKTASVFTSIMYNTITENAKKICEAVDKNNPDTFYITPEMRDEFFKQLNYNDSEAISDAIRQRVSTAMEDFVSANKKDHADITAALQQAQEKISDSPDGSDELHESYTFAAKRKATEVRNRPKGLFHSMVATMCESVIKHKEMHDEFMNENHLNVEKIVSRTSLMYTFVEMLNTAKIDNIDTVFVENLISNLGD